ncbi:MAG: hypothetical protein ABSF14_08705 [Terriglobia bacterium]
MAQEVESLLAVIFAGRRKAGKLDLEAVEMATRAALHRAGAARPRLNTGENNWRCSPGWK